MNEVESVTVALPTRMADSVRAAVAAGDYETPSEIVQEALLLWQSQRGLHAHESAALQKAWAEGKRSGIAGPLEIESIIASARAELKAG